ncbi:MAG: hypothetical protein AAB395_01100 [Patescibacteria group bacterium]
MKLAIAQFPKNKVGEQVIIFVYALAAVIILMVISQLVTIEKLLPIMDGYQLPGGSSTVKVLVFTMAISGVFALPFLLRMRLSPLFRIISAILFNIYSLIWLVLGIWVTLNNPPLSGTGIFGSLLASIPDSAVLPLGIALTSCSMLATILLRADLKFKN